MVANLRTQTVYILEPPGDGLAMSKGWPEGMAVTEKWSLIVMEPLNH
jgi:hypothetical protein